MNDDRNPTIETLSRALAALADDNARLRRDLEVAAYARDAYLHNANEALEKLAFERAEVVRLRARLEGKAI